MSVIRCHGLRKVYRSRGRETAALDGIDLTVERGEFLAVVGPSGSGKSTLLMTLGGLIRPTAGEVEVHGTRLDGLKPADLAEFRARTVGFVFQLFHLVPYLSATDNVLLAGFGVGGSFQGNGAEGRCATRGAFLAPLSQRLGRLWRPTTPWSSRERAEELLRSLNLEDRLSHRASELSAGEQQRVAIARALYNDPPVLLADEPTGNLDPENGLLVLDQLRRIHAEARTVVLVTHSLDAARGADRRVILRSGKLSEEPSPSPTASPAGSGLG